MKKLLLSSAIVVAMSQASYAAEKQSLKKEQTIGMGAGVIVGAIVGGPIGAFVGAMTGGLIGEQSANKDTIKYQQTKLSELASKTSKMNDVLADNNQMVKRIYTLENENESLIKSQVERILSMTIQFRTGSSSIEPLFASQLNELAEVLLSQPEIELDLNGFTDSRGDETLNLALSKKRVDSVKSYLIKKGINHKRLYTTAFGEEHAVAQTDDYEANFFDRKVTVTTRNPVFLNASLNQ